MFFIFHLHCFIRTPDIESNVISCMNSDVKVLESGEMQ